MDREIGKRVSFGTFHSVFYQILRLAYRFPPGNVIGEEEKRAYLKTLIDGTELASEDQGELISSLLNEISYVKGERLDLDCYYSQNCPEELFKKIYSGYEGMLREQGKLDFDDMLTMCWELFCERKDILSAWQRKYQYLLVDEFQDINRLQYEIVKLLALPENNLFIVGTTISRFTGSAARSRRSCWALKRIIRAASGCFWGPITGLRRRSWRLRCGSLAIIRSVFPRSWFRPGARAGRCSLRFLKIPCGKWMRRPERCAATGKRDMPGAKWRCCSALAPTWDFWRKN